MSALLLASPYTDMQSNCVLPDSKIESKIVHKWQKAAVTWLSYCHLAT